MGGAIGAGSGAALGLFAGCIIFVDIVVMDVRESQHYVSWRIKAIEEKALPIFQAFLKEDTILSELICPITLELPTVPMKAPDGRVYEKAAIEEHIDSTELMHKKMIELHPERVHALNRSPIRGQDFGKDDLVFDMERAKEIIRAAEKVFKECQERGESNIKISGLAAVIKNTKDTLDRSGYAVAMDLLRQGQENNLSVHDAMKITKKVVAQYEY